MDGQFEIESSPPSECGVQEKSNIASLEIQGSSEKI